jgi:arylsulfatase A-like enzyme
MLAAPALSDERPNVLWIIVEDMSPHFGCYGETAIETPNVDRLAAEGVQFNRAFVTAPVCSTARSALITGMYQSAIGAQHHRSGRGELKITLPEGVTPVPALLRAAAYYTTNGNVTNPSDRIAKTDYNFQWDDAQDGPLYEGNDWHARQPGQPFFAQIQLHGGKYRHGGEKWRERVEQTLLSTTPMSAVTLPPYYPDDPVIVDDWAKYLDTVRWTDHEVGQIMRRLDDEGLTDNTYVFFITDHGISHARGKQFCYDEGIHIPLVIRGPGIEAGTVRDDLVVHIDLAATTLALTGVDVPAVMQSRNILAADYQPRDVVVSARDRCDETVDRIRSARYKYIRNFYPQRPYLQPNAYKDSKPILIALRRLHAQGKLTPIESLVMAERRPAEELYDLENDPFEISNLADDPAHADTLESLRAKLETWIAEMGPGESQPEDPAVYASDMAAYLGSMRRQADRVAEIQANIEQMLRWAAEGK